LPLSTAGGRRDEFAKTGEEMAMEVRKPERGKEKREETSSMFSSGCSVGGVSKRLEMMQERKGPHPERIVEHKDDDGRDEHHRPCEKGRESGKVAHSSRVDGYANLLESWRYRQGVRETSDSKEARRKKGEK
jgi:hypothetical protein